MTQLILDHTKKTLELCDVFYKKWSPICTKQTIKFQNIYKEFIVDALENNKSGKEELSVHAQYLLFDCLKQYKEIFYQMHQEHRQIHPPISKCGKDLDRNFQSNLNCLLRNEKDIENNNEYRQTTNQLIFEHFLSLGRVELAEIFMEESTNLGTPFTLPCNLDLELMRSVMEPFRKREFLPAIKWLEENAPDKRNLLFKLHSEHIFQLLNAGNKKDAILYCRVLQSFAEEFKTNISHLMFMAVSWPNVDKSRYEYMFQESRWLTMEHEIAICVSGFRCPLSNLLNVGAKVIPPILTLRTLSKRNAVSANTKVDDNSCAFITEELPYDVQIEERVHSSFACPILRSQSTEANPPMRLGCGHVISNDALLKLVPQSRTLRLKCPYCPEESNQTDTTRVYF